MRNNQNIGLGLIELVNEKSVKEKIHNSANAELRKILNSYSGSAVIDDEIVYLSLAIIALDNYDSAFYTHVENTYTELYDNYPRQKIEGYIRSIIHDMRPRKGAARGRIISPVLEDAIVPQYFLPEFFEFIFDIYKLNFGCVLNDNMYQEFEFIYQGLRDALDPEIDDIQINVTKKTYRLIKSTKALILATEHIDSLIKFSIEIISIIDKAYWQDDGEEIKIHNVFFEKGFNKWIQKYHFGKSIRTAEEERQNTRYSRWEPSLSISGTTVFIEPPIHKVFSVEDFRTIKVVVENDGEIIHEDAKPKIIEIIGGYELTIDSVPVSNPLGKLTYKIYGNDDVIYNSNNKLYRSAIAFNTKGNELKNNKDYYGDVVFCHNEKVSDIADYYEADRYKLGVTKVDETSIIDVDGITFSFSSAIGAGVSGELLENQYVFIGQENIPVYRSIKQLVFETDSNNVNIGLSINGKQYKLSEFECKSAVRGTYIKYVVDMSALESGIYDLYGYDINTGRKLPTVKYKFAVDTEFEYELLQIDENSYIADVRSFFFEEVRNLDFDVSNIESIDTEFVYKGGKCKYFIPFEIPIYRIDKGQWYPLSRYIWIDDINHESTIEFYCGAPDEIEIRDDVGRNIDTIKLKNEVTFKSAAIGFIKSFKDDMDSTILCWEDRLGIRHGVKCYNKCVINQNETYAEFDPINKKLLVNIKYYGRGNVSMNLENSNGNSIFEKNDIADGSTLKLSGLKSGKKYSLVIVEKEKGLSLNKNKEIFRQEIKCFAYDDLLKKRYRIDNVLYDRFVDNQFIRETDDMYNTYVEFIKKTDELSYTGNIYFVNPRRDSEFFLGEINPVEIEIVGNIIDNTLELSMTKDQDGLLFNVSKKTIRNNVDDPHSPDIFSYIIGL